MKKAILLIGVLISIVIQAYAAKDTIHMHLQRRGASTPNTTVCRTPMRLPLEVVYDSETRQVEVTGDEETIAQVFLCDANGNTLDYSSSVNTVLNVPDGYSGLVILRIESEDWIAVGEIEI